jgi:ATP-dependent protease ClpP protease subunit
MSFKGGPNFPITSPLAIAAAALNVAAEAEARASAGDASDVEAVAIPFKAGKIVETQWNAQAAKDRVAKWASSDGSGDKDKVDFQKYGQAFAAKDTMHTSLFGAFHLPHHDVEGDELVVNKAGVSTAIAAIHGGRTTYQGPDPEGALAHLEQHAKEWREPEKEPEKSAKAEGEEPVVAANDDEPAWDGIKGEVSGDVLDLYLYAPIRAEGGLFSMLGGNSASSKSVQDQLAKAGKVGTIRLHVNSPGGDVFEGLAINALLKNHPAKVIAEIDGLCGSAATIPVMEADEILMAESSTMLIHGLRSSPNMGMPATAQQCRDCADKLDTISQGVENLYTAKSGQSVEKVRSMMAKDTWLSAADAKALGFCDSIIPAKRRVKPAPSPKALLMFCPGAPAEMIAACAMEAPPEQGGPIEPGQVPVVSDIGFPLPAATVQALDPQPPAVADAPAAATDQSGAIAQENKEMQLLATIAGILGLGADATEEAVVTGLNAIKTRAESAGTLLGSLEQLTGSTGDAVVGTVQAWKDAHEKLPTVQGELKTIQAKIDADAAEAKQTAHKSLVENAIKDGMLAEARREWAMAESTERLEAYLAAKIPEIPGAGQPPKRENQSTLALTAEEKRMGKTLGYTEEQMLASKRELASIETTPDAE